MNGSNNLLSLPLDFSPLVELIGNIIDQKFKEHENRLKSQSVVLTREDASNILKVRPNTITKYIKDGRLVNRGIGDKILLFKSDIDDYMRYKNNN
jgi:hypothetical protein